MSSETSQTPTPVVEPPPVVHSAPPAHPPHQPSRRLLVIAIVAAIVILGLIFGIPILITALNTVSTDDAYVNGHVTFTAPRVSGQVLSVYVDDNNRVKKGAIIVQLDPKPYQVQANIKLAAVTSAQADLETAIAYVRANEALARSLRWKLQHAMEEVNDQVALLHTTVASLESARAVSKRAKADFDRALPLVKTGAVSSVELDRLTQVLAVADADVKGSLQKVYQVRVGLGLPAQPQGGDLNSVPPDIEEAFSSVRQAQAELMQAAFQIGVVYSLDKSPKEMLADFLKRDPEGNIDKIYAKLLKNAPTVRQAQEKVAVAQRDLDQANLNLSYCTVYAEIDGVVTRRNVNPGNNVVAGQELMAIRSLTDIWVDANFKETELARLRIGQPVDLELDMYGKHKVFKGRVSGFTMGTGSTLALLPAQNATGNFVKVVQRLPVRIDIENYDPQTDPLFVGLSVEPRVYIKEAPRGPDAGKVLQPYVTTPAPIAPAAAPTTAPAMQDAIP
jgi:membrane fusion protein (multidrug efflux system)